MSGPQRPSRGGLGSRNPTGRPRKIASQTREVPDPAEEETPPPGEPPAGEPVAEPDDGGSSGRGLMIGLLVAIVVLVVVGALEAVYLVRDDQATISSSRPVVVGDATRAEAVRTAAQSTEEILSTSYEDYDAQIDEATSKMTDTFEQEYRETADGLGEKYADQKLKIQVKAVGQSVVSASPEQVQALLFLDQYVEKVEDGKPATDFAQYRALVTVVHTDQGWLVSDIETK